MINEYRVVAVNEEQVRDVRNIARGVYAPLTGFLRRDDFNSVLDNMRLRGGEVWTMPIVLDVSAEDYKRIKKEKMVGLVDSSNKPVAVLSDIELYENNKKVFAEKVFQTNDSNHPGVADVYKMGEYLLGGEIELLRDSREPFAEYNFTPQEMRKIFRDKGWKTIVAFQTRNVPHRAHEFLQMSALANVDGLFIQPVIGKKKPGDFRDDVIVSAYETYLRSNLSDRQACLGVLALGMRYAGPREAVWHALIRKNFGCTHFIVGRDHAGVGSYYGSYDAQKIFDIFPQDEIGVEILRYDNAIFCKGCGGTVFEGACVHSDRQRVSFSGTQIRDMIVNNRQVPEHIMRPEIVELIRQTPEPFVN